MCRLLKRAAPHYLLLCEAKSFFVEEKARGGKWAFVLEEVGSSQRIEVAECEPDVTGERLQLLAVVRGLEALEQHSRVTLFTSSRYVGHGIRQHLATWRDNGFRWERFGEMRVIKYRELWRRIDNAMKFHAVDCRVWQFNESTMVGSAPYREPAGSSISVFERDEFVAPASEAKNPFSVSVAKNSRNPTPLPKGRHRSTLARESRYSDRETRYSGELVLG